jgi:RNA polymerase sigma factor (sigma-70 family)
MNKTRVTLIQRLKNPKDAEAWKQFYQFYWEVITGWAQRAGCDYARAQDIFQETMICLMRKLQKFDYDPQQGSFRALLKIITISRVKDMFRREGRYALMETEDVPEQQVNKNQTDQDDIIWTQSILRQALRRCYAKIDQTTYKSFCLYVLDNLPINEVCQRLDNIRPGTVYQQKSRLLQMLENEFFKLLTEMDNIPFATTPDRRRYLIKALEEMVKDNPNYRETIIQPFKPQNFQQLDKVIMTLQQADLAIVPYDTLVLIDKELVTAFEFKPKITVGKKAECDIIIDQQDISGRHAEFTRKEDTYSVKDLNSTNGILLNGRKTKTSNIANGDIIQLAEQIFIVLLLKE